jgi:hypothetical protein
MLKIMLWRNSFGAKAMSHPGHVALAIGQGGKPDHYISYWPVANSSGTPVSARPAKFNRFAQDLMAELGSNARTRLQAGSTPRPGQANDNVINVDGFTVDNPQNVWVKMPDETFDIPIADSQNGVGLSQEHIVDWWKLFSTDLGYKHRYRFISRKINCASIVMSALTVGGARMFVKPDRQFMYYSPNDIGKYARQLTKKINKMRQAAAVVQNAPQTPGVTYSVVDPNGPDIWSLAAWKKLSAVRIGRRHSQVAAIDGLVQQYWNIGGHWTIDNCNQKALVLYQVLEQIQDHIASKPKSDRREAVFKLGRRILEVVKDRATVDQAMEDALVVTVGRELM